MYIFLNYTSCPIFWTEMSQFQWHIQKYPNHIYHIDYRTFFIYIYLLHILSISWWFEMYFEIPAIFAEPVLMEYISFMQCYISTDVHCCVTVCLRVCVCMCLLFLCVCVYLCVSYRFYFPSSSSSVMFIHCWCFFVFFSHFRRLTEKNYIKTFKSPDLLILM